MTIRLIYHDIHDLYANSPFDEAIIAIAKGHELRLACPYITVDYLERVTKLSTSWRLITDIEEWLWSMSRPQQKNASKFMAENPKSIRHISRMHAKVVLSEKSALIGSANLTIAGITERTEMAIIIEEEAKLKELGSWFEGIWGDGFKLPLEEDIDAFIESLPKRDFLSPKKTKLFPKSAHVSHPLFRLPDQPPASTHFPLKLPDSPYEGRQVEIVDAILGA